MDKGKEAEEQPILRISTKKYNAIPVKNSKEENMFIVTTAKRSRIRAKTICPECGLLVSRYDMRICSICGRETCTHCVKEKGNQYLCTRCAKAVDGIR